MQPAPGLRDAVPDGRGRRVSPLDGGRGLQHPGMPNRLPGRRLGSLVDVHEEALALTPGKYLIKAYVDSRGRLVADPGRLTITATRLHG